jgi:hypothetical protein
MAATQAGVAAWAGGVGIDVDMPRTRGGEVCVQARVRRQAQLAAGMLQGRFAPDRLCVALAASPHFHLPSAPSGGAWSLASTFSPCMPMTRTAPRTVKGPSRACLARLVCHEPCAGAAVSMRCTCLSTRRVSR